MNYIKKLQLELKAETARADKAMEVLDDIRRYLASEKFFYAPHVHKEDIFLRINEGKTRIIDAVNAVYYETEAD